MKHYYFGCYKDAGHYWFTANDAGGIIGVSLGVGTGQVLFEIIEKYSKQIKNFFIFILNKTKNALKDGNNN